MDSVNIKRQIIIRLKIEIEFNLSFNVYFSLVHNWTVETICPISRLPDEDGDMRQVVGGGAGGGHHDGR